LTYKKCTEDLSHTFDFINIKPVIKKEIPFFEKIKPLRPWEMLRTNANPSPMRRIPVVTEKEPEQPLSSRQLPTQIKPPKDKPICFYQTHSAWTRGLKSKTAHPKYGCSKHILRAKLFTKAGAKMIHKKHHKLKTTPFSGFSRSKKNPFCYKKLYPEKIR